MVSVYVMRHAETEANIRQVLMGREDSPFTELGWRQPVEVARQLRGLELSCIYASPMERALRTAQLVRETLGAAIPLQVEPALAEIDAGEFTGLTFQEVRRRVSGRGVVGMFRYPGGESWADVQARAVEFVAGMEERADGESVLLVTHAGVIAGLVADFLDEPIERYIRTRFGHDFLGRLSVEDGAMVAYEKVAGTVDRWF